MTLFRKGDGLCQQKTGSILAAISGLLGVVMLSASFSLNVGPPSDATTSSQLIAFDNQNFALIL